MNRLFRSFASVLVGLVLGSAVNMGLIFVGPMIIPPPVGADVTSMEGLKASLPLFEARHFLFPFLAHALGTLMGALVAGLMAPARSVVPAYIVGAIFLLGGAGNAMMLPAPIWFTAADLLLAYVPMTWLGQAMAGRIRPV